MSGDGWREGAAHQFYGPNNATDLWQVKKVNPQSMIHLTEKPVELAVRALQYSSRAGENVIDLFGGSGSTLIAAEQTTPAEVEQRPRSVLADWLTSPKHPLTARVWANRVWQWHFGRGIVATPNDFGTRGAVPTHPELLDWLASELIDKNWSTKHLHRLIVTSAAYRQSSIRAGSVSDGNTNIDPDNHMLWRWPLRRLEVEAIRDSLLAVSGELDRTLGGSAIEKEDDCIRRTLYLQQRRNKPTQVQKLFDGPAAALESCPQRHVSTVPLQSLYLLNNPYALQRAKAFAARVARQAATDRGRQIETAFRLALGRAPAAAERSAAERFFADYEGDNALADFCQAVLNLNEFVYLE